jgi:hypothetical protein
VPSSPPGCAPAPARRTRRPTVSSDRPVQVGPPLTRPGQVWPPAAAAARWGHARSC